MDRARAIHSKILNISLFYGRDKIVMELKVCQAVAMGLAISRGFTSRLPRSRSPIVGTRQRRRRNIILANPHAGTSSGKHFLCFLLLFQNNVFCFTKTSVRRNEMFSYRQFFTHFCVISA